MNFGVIVFPGSSGDRECFQLISETLKENVDYIWHTEKELKKDYDCLILPGGFSYGDYLRPGAISKASPIIEVIKDFSEAGGLVLGLGNGFQILTEISLLPGAFLRNENLKFVCKDVDLKLKNNKLAYTHQYKPNEILTMPIAHELGAYYIDKEGLKELKENKQIVFTYENYKNGSVEDIAAVSNKKGNVLGMMVRPERCAEKIFGNTSGLKIFTSILASLKGGRVNE